MKQISKIQLLSNMVFLPTLANQILTTYPKEMIQSEIEGTLRDYDFGSFENLENFDKMMRVLIKCFGSDSSDIEQTLKLSEKKISTLFDKSKEEVRKDMLSEEPPKEISDYNYIIENMRLRINSKGVLLSKDKLLTYTGDDLFMRKNSHKNKKWLELDL